MFHAPSTGMTGQEKITFGEMRQGRLLHETSSCKCPARRVPPVTVGGRRGNTRMADTPNRGLTLNQIFYLTRPVEVMCAL